MSALKIINSPSARILTQCIHCFHIMKTPADALYYLVECPRCVKDFIVKKYQNETPVKKVSKSLNKTETPDLNSAFIRAIYNNSWTAYKSALLLLIITGTTMLGLNNELQMLLWVFSGLVAATLIHFFILCVGGMYIHFVESTTSKTKSP